uniref:Uncharacterized protein n=1 Tax=Hippocampus comes TaxID=109280 RepID=A0A3Q2Y8T5_HIPCM
MVFIQNSGGCCGPLTRYALRWSRLPTMWLFRNQEMAFGNGGMRLVAIVECRSESLKAIFRISPCKMICFRADRAPTAPFP